MNTSMEQSIIEQTESKVRGYCRSFPAVFASASGSLLKDTEGKEYIDFLAACGSLNYGHNDPDMSQALVEHIQSGGLSAGLDLLSTTKASFLYSFQRLILRPRGLDYRVQFTGPTGTNAVEAAMKLARKVTGRQNILSFTNGFHGVSLGALAATGNKYNRMGASLPDVTRVPYDGYMGQGVDTSEFIEKLIVDPSSGVEKPAAIILETVQGEGGLNAASNDWLKNLANVAKKHGVLLIVDDIQAGCGRTGRFFSFEASGIEPDIVTLSKSISGFGLPMALVLMKPNLDQWGPAEHNGTFRGNTHAFVTAQVALEKYWSNSMFTRQIALHAHTVRQALEAAGEMVPGSYVKGRGMMLGLCVESGDLASRITRRCFEKSLIIETSGPNDEVIKVLAPLNTPEAILQKGLGILNAAIADVMEIKPELRLVNPLNAAAPERPAVNTAVPWSVSVEPRPGSSLN